MKRKILAVDDDAVILGAFQVFFEAQDWEFHGAGTGEAGLKKAAEIRPDVILLDVNLPDMQGWDICRKIREDQALGAVPILLISGQRKASEDVVEGLKAGADDYLPKPVSFPLLLEKIKTVMRAGKGP